MTLLITVATKRALYQSSDYRLSDGGRSIETENGAKQLSVQGRRWIAQVSFTGIAKDGNGYDTRSWLQETAAAVQPEALIESFVDGLVQRGTQALSTIRNYDKRLTVVVAAVEASAARLFIATNWEPLFAPATQDRDQLRYCEVNIARPRVLVHGNAGTVPRSLRRWIQRLVVLRSDRDRIASALAMVNAFAAGQSGGTISQGCWVQGLFSDGNSFGRNHGVVPGNPSNIVAGGLDMGQWLATEFPPAPGKKITLVQSVGYMGPGTPAPTEVGEARTIQVSSPANAVSITLGAGGPLVGTLSTSSTATELTVHKNQYSSTSFGMIAFAANTETLCTCRPFAAKRLCLPCVPTVDGAQPRSWDYSFNLDFDGSALKLTVMQNSMSFRSANAPAPLSLLQENEELVMAAPVGGITLTVTSASPQGSASLDAQFLLRDFPELQRNAEVP